MKPGTRGHAEGSTKMTSCPLMTSPAIEGVQPIRRLRARSPSICLLRVISFWTAFQFYIPAPHPPPLPPRSGHPLGTHIPSSGNGTNCESFCDSAMFLLFCFCSLKSKGMPTKDDKKAAGQIVQCTQHTDKSSDIRTVQHGL